MKMPKIIFVRRAVLLLAFVLLFATVVATAVVAADGDPSITVTFNEEECRVLLSYTGLAEPKIMKSDEPMSVPYGAEVTVTVIPNLGYELKDIQDLDNPNNSIKELYEDSYHSASFLKSVRAEVICSTSVFNVKFEQADVTKLPYTPESGNMNELAGLKYYYMQSEEKTILPTVVRSGYTFQYWQVVKSNGEEVQKITTKTEDGKFYIPSEIINQDMVDNGTIYLHAEFTPDMQLVTRYDHVFNTALGVRDKLLGTYEWQTAMDTLVSGLTQMGDDAASDDPANPYLNYKSYPGYKLFVEGDYPFASITMPTPQKPNPNVFYRFYVPVVYELVYENLADGTLPEGAAQTYTYAAHTPIAQPTRRGYTFMGWKVTVDGVVVDEQTGVDFVLGNQGDEGNIKYAAKDEKIILTAIWQANTYGITYDWNVSDPALKAELDSLNAALPGGFVFDAAALAINDPIRHGYKFLGWTLHYTNGEGQPATEELTSEGGKYMLNCSTYAQDIKLTANWQVETYTVVLDGKGGENEYTTQIPGVVYDTALTLPEGFTVPTRVGYTFRGYWSAAEGGTMYIDENGNSVCSKWDLYEDTDGVITLYAHWDINYYNVTIENIVGLPASAQATIRIIAGTTYTYTGEPISLPYQTTFRVEIVMPANFKIVHWNGTDLAPHSGEAFLSGEITLGAEDMTLTAQARPTAPTLSGDVDSIRPKSDTEIKVLFASADIAKLYEVAISLDGNVANLAADAWRSVAEGEDNYLFANLQPGTTYYVFVRLEATTETLSGIPLIQPTLTKYDEYVEGKVDHLHGLLTENDGDIAKGVIQQAIDKIDELRSTDPLPTDFYEQIEAIIAAIDAKLAFARYQDAKIAALQNHREECLSSGSFSSENNALLNSLCANAVANISGATTEEEVESIYATVKAAMEAVPVTYLYDASGAMQLTSLLGLSQNSGITLSSINDIKALRRAISDAIAQGKITADSFITIEEATELLRALDTVAAYSFNLINVQSIDGDVFTLRLTIPEHLSGSTGLQVAYFNQATGMLELLETTVEGNTLVFKAKQITDFVILADPTVDLTYVILALAAILLCQLIAIALVLVSRSKAKNSVLHASVALPVFLTVHFLPVANAELIALGLGIAVLVAQIVLMWLLISSGMIRVFKTKRTDPQEAKEVTAVVREEDLNENPYAAFDEETAEDEIIEETAQEESEQEVVEEQVEEEPTEEIFEEEPAEEIYEEEPFDEELAAEVSDEIAREEQENLDQEAIEEVIDEEIVEEELPEEVEEIYDDEEFIEQAPNPYYSLDEEEDYAYNQEETERVSDVDTSDTQTEEAPFGDDPFDGVFGAAYGQDSDSGNEGGDPFYEEPYDQSYEYGDEEDSAYAEPEILDEEETGSEGSVDPTAYLVNDEEELSDEEELYQYDE